MDSHSRSNWHLPIRGVRRDDWFKGNKYSLTLHEVPSESVLSGLISRSLFLLPVETRSPG